MNGYDQQPQPLIGIDVDNVLIKHTEAWLAAFRALTGVYIDIATVKQWDIAVVLGSEAEHYRPLLNAARTAALYTRPTWVAGAVGGLLRLVEVYGERRVRLVSYEAEPSGDIARAKAKAIHNTFGLSVTILHPSVPKWSIGLAELVDDAPHHNPSILFTQPWNADAEHPKRVNDWHELLRELIDEQGQPRA